KEAKRRKLSEEAQEADDLKKRLEIVQDEDDDKVPVIDYQVVVINNKPRYKIIRADDTHQFYISFTTLLKNFDREDLETLWRIVKYIFSTSKPTNFSDEYLLLTLKTMFGELDKHDAIWRNQKSVHGLALVKRWKLLTLCGVHVIILSTVQLFLLVERRYPLSRFTLEQLVNVARLQVEEKIQLFLLVERRYPLSRFTLEQLVNVARLQAKVKAIQDAAAVAHANLYDQIDHPQDIFSNKCGTDVNAMDLIGQQHCTGVLLGNHSCCKSFASRRIPTTVPFTTPTIDPPVIHDDTSLIPTKTPMVSPITSMIPPTAPATHYTSPFIRTDSSDDETPDTPPSPTHEIPPVKVAPPIDSSSKMPLDSFSDALSNSSSSHSSLDHSSPTLPSGPSYKRSRSPTTSVLVSSPVPGALSFVHVDLLPPRKRIRSSDSTMDLKDCLDESSESPAEIDECIAYANALRDERIDARVVVKTVAREEVETSGKGMIEVRVDRVTHLVVSDDIHEPALEEGAIEVTCETLGDLVQRFHDHTMKIPVHRVQVIESIQRDQEYKIVATGQQGAVLSERINELDRDNTRLRGLSAVIMSLIMSLKYEHGVVN
nr:hypothetical protein [Tanacetum cinerariifolium]